MSNLFSTLVSSVGALQTFDRALAVTQNNIANIATPGYARERLRIEPISFGDANGAGGGVRAGGADSARDPAVETTVRRHLSGHQGAEQAVASLQSLELAIDYSSESGIAGALSGMWRSFSSWSVTPNDSSARQAVLDQAATVAASFRQVAAGLDREAVETATGIRETVGRINALAGEVARWNSEVTKAGGRDGAIDARLHQALEELSALADVQAIEADDGSTTVLLGGRAALVVGASAYAVAADFAEQPPPGAGDPPAPPSALIRDAAGAEVGAAIRSGRLGGLLQIYNGTLPHLRGDGQRQGELNRLAQAVADRVNDLLGSGLTEPGGQAGQDLFVYGANPTAIARSLDVATVTPADLAPYEPGPPPFANGIALRLAALATPQADADRLDGLSYQSFYGALAGGVGRELARAREQRDVGAEVLAQAREYRETVSAVSLDQEAAMLIQFQRAYQANSRLITTLNELTEEVLRLLS